MKQMNEHAISLDDAQKIIAHRVNETLFSPDNCILSDEAWNRLQEVLAEYEADDNPAYRNKTMIDCAALATSSMLAGPAYEYDNITVEALAHVTPEIINASILEYYQEDTHYDAMVTGIQASANMEEETRLHATMTREDLRNAAEYIVDDYAGFCDEMDNATSYDQWYGYASVHNIQTTPANDEAQDFAAALSTLENGQMGFEL